MDVLLASLLNLYAFSSGRRLFAMTQVQKLASAANLSAIAAHAEAAITFDKETRALEAKWLGQRSSTFSADARQIDMQVDASLTALRDGIESQIRASAQDDPLANQAQEMQKTLFPRGAGAITSKGYVEELAEVARILARLEQDDYKALVKDLGLSRQVTRLGTLEKQYRAAIEGPGQLAFDKVKEARAKGQSLMLQAVAMILGAYPSDSEADVKARGKLLEPILVQNEAIRRYLRERRAVEDVNPDTGEVETSPGQTEPSQGNEPPR